MYLRTNHCLIMTIYDADANEGQLSLFGDLEDTYSQNVKPVKLTRLPVQLTRVYEG